MIHLVQLSLQQNPNWIVLKLDARNAFNSVSRQSTYSIRSCTSFSTVVSVHFQMLCQAITIDNQARPVNLLCNISERSSTGWPIGSLSVVSCFTSNSWFGKQHEFFNINAMLS